MKLSVIILLTFSVVIGSAMSGDMKKQSFMDQKLSKFKDMVQGAVCSIIPNIAGTIASNLCVNLMLKMKKNIAIKTSGITDAEKYAPACFDAMVPPEAYDILEECVTELVRKKMESMKEEDSEDMDSEESNFQAIGFCVMPKISAKLDLVYDKDDFNAGMRKIIAAVVGRNRLLPDKVKARILKAVQNDLCRIPGPSSSILPAMRHEKCWADLCLMAMASQYFA